MIGQTIAQYKILEKLGEGGMGVVYKAEDTKLERIVALKFLPHHLTSSEAEQSRFLQEAKAAAALNHPNVCSVIDIQEVDGPAFAGAPAGRQQFIVMEYVDGVTLRKKAPIAKLDEAIGYAVQIGEALQAAHAKGIVHRDVKSENVMVTNDGRVKVMDFGLAKLKGSLKLTKTSSTVGTLAYMAPEQIQGLDVDQRADLWGFGVILFEMLTGELPFRGEHDAATMYEILNVDPKAIQTLRSDIPEHLQVLISRLFQKDPAKRIASAAEIIEQLKKPSRVVPSTSRDKSIAVLYFENMSSEKESDYFCAGMTEDIITDLSKIRELKVVSRTDVLPFRSKEVNTRQVGDMLRVNYVLEGSVRKSGNKMRITAQLIDIHTGFHLWADRFDRLIEDIFDVQTEVSQRIAEALKVSLTDSEKQSLAQKPTDDLKAYDFYLRGKELVYRRGKKNNESAIKMFENALSIDPNFAAAYAGLSEAYSYMHSWYDSDPKWLGKIIETSQKALSLEPDSVEAQYGIGMAYYHQKRYAEAKRTLEQVVQKSPDYYDPYRWLGAISDVTGEYDAAIKFYERCAQLKPYSEEPWMHLDMTFRRKGDVAASDRAQRTLLELGERKLQVNPDDATTLSRVASPYAHFGETEKAKAALKRVLAIDPTDGLAQYNCACTYAVLGDKNGALTCLKTAIQNGFNAGEWAKNDPDFISLRDEPEFKVLLAEIG